MNQKVSEMLASVRYRFLKELGEGTTAKINQEIDLYLNRVIARKVFHKALLDDQRLTRTFVNEARLIGGLNHPGIVPVYNIAVDSEQQLSYTMPMVEGKRLSELMQCDPVTGNGRALPLARALSILIKLCETLSYAHDKGVLHLDLKPDNIMVGNYGEVFILDWGSGRIMDKARRAEWISKAYPNIDLDDNGADDELFLGTPKYMSPEQTTALRSELRPQSDIFSLGIVAYQLFCGQHPFQAKDMQSLFAAICSQEIPRLDHINPILPARLASIVGKMLRKPIEGRYADFKTISDDLRTLQNAGVAFEIRDFQANEIIFRQNDSPDYAFVIMSGEVEVSLEVDGIKRVMSTLGTGEIVGELGVITRQARTATVTAITPTKVNILDKNQLQNELESLSPWVSQIIKGLAARFNDINLQLAARKSGPGSRS